MIPIIITPETLYSVIKHPKFRVLGSYLLDQQIIRFYAPSHIYQELEKKYEPYGIRRMLRRAAPPTEQEKELLEKLKKIITLVPVAEGNPKYIGYKEMAPYIQLFDQMQAYGIWDDRLFRAKFEINTAFKTAFTVSYVPTEEIMRFLGRKSDFLIKN